MAALGPSFADTRLPTLGLVRRGLGGQNGRTGGDEASLGADLLLHDSQYTEDEYAHRLGWGHSSVAHAAAFSRAAGVRQLAMFHHDPMRSDRELEELYDHVAAVVRDEQEPPLIAREGLEVALGAG